MNQSDRLFRLLMYWKLFRSLPSAWQSALCVVLVVVVGGLWIMSPGLLLIPLAFTIYFALGASDRESSSAPPPSSQGSASETSCVPLLLAVVVFVAICWLAVDAPRFLVVLFCLAIVCLWGAE